MLLSTGTISGQGVLPDRQTTGGHFSRAFRGGRLDTLPQFRVYTPDFGTFLSKTGVQSTESARDILVRKRARILRFNPIHLLAISSGQSGFLDLINERAIADLQCLRRLAAIPVVLA